MKNLTFIVALILSASLYGQAPEGFNYQSVIRDGQGSILSSQSVGIQLMIRQGSTGGGVVYTETHAVITNSYGLVNMVIGTGTSGDDFSAIDWSVGPYFLETSIDVTGGTSYIVMGTSQFMSVPYAMHAKTAESVANDQVDDADADPTNEIQTLSINGDQLSVSDANTVTIPSSPWKSSDTQIWTTSDSVGIGTSSPIDQLHILGSTTNASLTLTPNEPFSGDDAQIVLCEDDDNTYNMTMAYDGGDNRMYFYGKNNATINGPHLGINRDNGWVGIGTGIINPTSELEVVGTITATDFIGDASTLTNVYADSIRGSMGATAGQYLEFDGTKWAPISSGRYAFHASASTDQTCGDTAWDTLRVNNSSSGENFEYPAGVFDNSTYGFIVPEDGVYFFAAAALWDNANLAETRNAIFIRVNNTDEVGEWSVSGATDFFGTSVSTTLELKAGDEIRVRIYNGDSANMDTFSQSGKYCYFSGYMLFPN